MKERRHISAHLFQRDLEWHCFYFSYSDIEEEDSQNHWKHGTHLHYVSHLWPRYDRDQIWDQFDKRSTDIPGNLHIRFIPFQYPPPLERFGRRSKRGYPKPDIFDPASAEERSEVFAPACLLTRGYYVASVSIDPRALKQTNQKPNKSFQETPRGGLL